MNSLEETFAALNARTTEHRNRLSGTIPAPAPAKPSKNDLTTEAAREIIDAETRERSERTARLRALRLAAETREAG